MWKDIPRKTLYFGAGCFGILSTSYVKNPSFGELTFTSYLALLYLAGIYCHRSFLGGGQVGNGVNWELSDTEALDSVRVVLPALNLVICKCGQLFCGDPFTTLKVAAMLWVLAQLGYWISLWSFARLAFILLVAVRAYFSQFPEVRLTRYPHNDYSGNSEQDELPPIIAPVEERALRTQPVLKEVKLETS
ncbi:hypothetical protein MPTK1_1g17300 [Marchantia polymorpha subsp. ruderalis]|uniref:Reticulon domain-containing protein n=2 Tax=Marchantia polymorpha TaxID=3197 RepID=A0AAF6AR63_MARPO|nr:hypothetical protein MARPO_0001s0070 [Marchantia polymorpha]BBM98933.1 hypothetical protein Mp_1g17300 [Marchantia polymorpha subsp. ruderalis]|eukprot:PTQ50009.1 hypothetical protein MARPO_0001s0070 [Marchantia polymorpha]